MERMAGGSDCFGIGLSAMDGCGGAPGGAGEGKLLDFALDMEDFQLHIALDEL